MTKPNEDSFDSAEETKEPTVAELMATMRKMQEQIDMKNTNEGEDDALTERQPASDISIAVYEDMPVIDMKLETVTGTNHLGNLYTKGQNAICTVYGRKTPVKLTYGDEGSPNDYTSLPRKIFKLVDVDMGDKSGASRVEHGVVVSRGEKIPEIDRSSGMPVRTGKMVEQVTRKNVRYYTIMVNGEKVELPEDKIYR